MSNLVIFCPGYSGLPPKKLNPLLYRFHREGWKTVSVNYRNFGRGDITSTAERVVHVANLYRKDFDHVALIGHSMGGLVARKALLMDSTIGDSLVTLGSPHRGTQAANTAFWWLGGWSVGQMKPDSRFLTHLNYPTTPTLTVTGTKDLLVKDGSIGVRVLSARAARGKEIQDVTNLELPNTHMGLITNPRVFGEVYCWLQYEQVGELP